MAGLSAPTPASARVTPPRPAAASSEAKKPSFPPEMEWDVAGAVEDLLAHLPPPREVEFDASALATVVALEGDKDTKTVNSIMVHTNRCAGWPRPKGSIVVVTHFDNQSQASFKNHLVSNGIELVGDDEMPYFIRLDAPQGRHLGRGDVDDPAGGEYVRRVFFGVLEALAARKDVGLHVIDGFGDSFVKEVSNDASLYEAGCLKFKEMQPTDWMPRRKLWVNAMNRIEASVVPGGCVVVNGPENDGDGEQKTVILPNGNRELRLKKGKWLGYREVNRPIGVTIHVDETEDENGDPQWTGNVLVGRVAGFRKGSRADLTNRHAYAIAVDSGAVG